VRRISPSILKNLLPIGILTAGFALISLGVGTIFGVGAGEIAAGLGLALLVLPIIRE
jgi:hypothetical protein